MSITVFIPNVKAMESRFANTNFYRFFGYLGFKLDPNSDYAGRFKTADVSNKIDYVKPLIPYYKTIEGEHITNTLLHGLSIETVEEYVNEICEIVNYAIKNNINEINWG